MAQILKVISKNFRDLHELEAADYKWNLPFKKISVGNFHGAVHSIDLGVVQMAEGRFSGTLLQNGLTPPGFTTFAIPAIDSQAFWWHYRKVDHNHLLLFPESRKLKCISYDGFHVYTFSIQDQFLKILIDKFGITGVAEKLKGSEKVIPITKRYIYILNSLLQTLSLAVQAKGEADFPKGLINSTKYKLTEIVLHVVDQSDNSTNVPIKRERDRTILKAIEFILDQEMQQLSIDEIAAKTNIKKRSLEYAFKEYATVSPKRFIQALRLNSVREDLILKGDSVSETAIRHGFTHQGQMARDYKLLFGEMPRETLKWARQLHSASL